MPYLKYLIYLLFLCLFACHSTKSDLVYLTNQSGNFDIFRTDIDGSFHATLTTNPGWDWYPKWNAGLNGIVYYSNDTSGNFSIRCMTVDGQQLPLETFGLEEVIVSPDGEKILYTTKDSLHSYIHLHSTIDGKKSKVIKHPSYNGRPKWAPNSMAFSFISDRTGSNELFLYRILTNDLEQLTNNNLREKYTSWSQKGDALLFTGQLDHQDFNNLYLLNLRNKKVTQLSNDDQLYEEIAWSPDEKLIAYHGKINKEDHIFLRSLDGKIIKQLTTSKAYHGEPEWIPNKN